jgi:hypothetical protein
LFSSAFLAHEHAVVRPVSDVDATEIDALHGFERGNQLGKTRLGVYE